MDTLQLAHTIVDALEDKKGENICLIEIREVATFADYFIVCSGTSERMLRALADAARVQVKSDHGVNGRAEGTANDGWVLVDFGDVVLHLFSPEKRHYYRLEELWNQGKVVLRLQ